MNDEPRRTLRELIARHGPGLCSDARRCEGLLRDLCGEHRREINILIGALRDRVPLDLLAGRNSVPMGLLLTRLAKRLEDQLALTEGAASWAIDTWALALGVVSDIELEEIKSRRNEAAVPHVEPTPGATRPASENETRARGDSTRVSTRPPAAPPRTQQSPPPPATQIPSTSNQAGPRAPTPKATRPNAQGNSSAASRQSSSPPVARPPASPQAANTGPSQAPFADANARSGRGRRWRGCLIGCFLLLILTVLLIAGAPFVLNILREEQQQRNLEPPRGQTP